jgi:hypothetical protein
LKGFDAAVKTLTTASASIPSIAAISAATAAPLGIVGASGGLAVSTLRSTSSITFALMIVPPPSSCRAQLRHGRAETEGHHQIEECRSHQHRDRVAKPRPVKNLDAVLPEDERRHHGERQREERPELLELEEDLMDVWGVLDEVRSRAPPFRSTTARRGIASAPFFRCTRGVANAVPRPE